MPTGSWTDELAANAPDVVAAWRGIDADQFLSVRREVRRRTGVGATQRIVPQLAATAAALAARVTILPDEAFGMPGGEADWTVAETIGHVAAARSGLVLAAALAAGGRWPEDAPVVVPGVPGDASMDRASLVRKIEQSQRIIVRSARVIAGHEADPCPLVHPLVGRLRCGEWLLFAGVHDLMHVEQLDRIAARLPNRAVATDPAGGVG
jgi:DinB superfamily